MAEQQLLFDKLAYIDRLTRAGIAEHEARAHAEAMEDALRESVATKSDIARLSGEIAHLESASKADMARLRSDLEHKIEISVRDTTIRTGAMLIALFSALVAIKFLDRRASCCTPASAVAKRHSARRDRSSWMSEHILTARKGPMLEITLNRPEIGNAASDAMAVELTKLLLAAGDSADIVVLRGAGADFCVGRESMGKRPPGGGPEALELRRRNDVVFNCYGAFRRCEIPVIGVVRGRAYGFGCAIAAVCDITLAADTARFQVPEMAHNIMPTMVMSALVDRVPRKALTYLVWSTAIITPQRAREAGIVSEVHHEAALETAVEALCAQIMKAPRPARVGCKDYARAALDMDITGAVEYARSIHAVINSSSEMLPKGHA